MLIEVFECNSGVAKATGNAYNIVLARIDDRVGKVFSDVPLPKGNVEVEMALSPNREMFLTPKIAKVLSK